MATPPEDSLPLREDDVRALVRLLGEVASADGPPDHKKRLLMDGLCRLIEADFWVWTLWTPAPIGQAEGYAPFQHGGFSPERYALYRSAIDHPLVSEVIGHFESELLEKHTHLTRTLALFDTENRLPNTEVGHLLADAGIGPIMISCRPLDDGARSAIGLYRHDGRAHFGEREANLAHIVLSEVPWLHFQNGPRREPAASSAPRLSKSERAVLELLAEGAGRKAIASRLSLSEHTVNDYVKAVYRHFSVNSQSRLISRLSKGDGGDRP